MTAFFFDTSALVKLYVAETGSSWVRNIADATLGNEIAISRIAAAEAVAAFARRNRDGTLTASETSTAIADFKNDYAKGFRVFDVNASLIDRAMQLAEAHSIRGYDAVHLAAAREFVDACADAGVGCVLVSADVDLNAAATAEGLTVEDPNAHP